jgi:hypothetical protein
VGISVAAFILVLVLGPFAATAGSRNQTGPPPNLVPGDRVEDYGGVALIVPPRGFGIGMEEVTADGGTQTLDIVTDHAGSVLVSGWGNDVEAGASDSGASSPPACSDDAQNPLNFKWYDTFHWSFNKSSTPTEADPANIERALIDATDNIPAAYNDCAGLGDNVSATQAYDGTTTRRVDINDDASCQPGSQIDGVSVVKFGNLPTGKLAWSCWWYKDTGKTYMEAVEVDMKINLDYMWAAYDFSGCTDKWILVGVATHERGHAFGLGHVDESTHGNLTMSPFLNGKCQSSEKTLGKGDVHALEARY